MSACVRCSHPLPPKADRCLRCFALNPPAALGVSFEEPAQDSSPLEVEFADDGPRASPARVEPEPVAPRRAAPRAKAVQPRLPLSLDELDPTPPPRPRGPDGRRRVPALEAGAARAARLAARRGLPPLPFPPAAQTPLPAAAPLEVVSAPEDWKAAPAEAPSDEPQPGLARAAAAKFAAAFEVVPSDPLTPLYPEVDAPASSVPDEDSAEAAKPKTAREAATRGSPAARLAAWLLDGALLAALVAGFAGLSIVALGPGPLSPRGGAGPGYWLDLLASAWPWWAALFVVLGLAYSALFCALGGRTPGLALAGLRIVPLRGVALSPGRALARALLSLVSAALGLSGFALALFDARGQTLHDKLCGCVAVTDG